jgi:hypothetical protein
MIKQYEIEKWVWDETDFEIMGWHDSRIYAVAFYSESFEFALDIDYIFQWVHPPENETYFKFWVAPATLVFENVYDLEFNIEIGFGEILEIADLERTQEKDFDNKEIWQWILSTQQGEIKFKSSGYKQFIRKEAVFGHSQTIDTSVRGGISFHRGRLDS